MTKKRLFFFDIDHTLYNNEKKIIPPQTQKLLHQLSQNRNNVLGIATGRSQSGLRVLQELKKLFRYFIVFNGAITFEKEKIIQKQVIPLQDVLKINQKALEAGNQIFNFSLEKKTIFFK
ncbi:HAD family hydrolase [Candidatus Phytoplasma australiense]|uniref:HAD family hydrolase n=1 Tax=Phytoplasma australiense TaxID=59748 RepID=UPI0003A990E8|nr:HAD hydrolase family protein [Candidatus Phytoplasma australiense]